jgi:PI-3-kinase-related kinase SMG-1
MQLLDRISQDYPHVVVFPAVVGARVDDADELTPQQRQYGAIKSTLVHRNPSLVSDVEMLLTELGRITLLWEEQALTSLREIQADVSGRIRTLRGEYARIGDQFSNTDNNSNTAVEKRRLLADVYATVMKPAIVKLERLFKDILREPQTKHEHWFQATYKRGIYTIFYF